MLLYLDVVNISMYLSDKETVDKGLFVVGWYRIQPN